MLAVRAAAPGEQEHAATSAQTAAPAEVCDAACVMEQRAAPPGEQEHAATSAQQTAAAPLLEVRDALLVQAPVQADELQQTGAVSCAQQSGAASGAPAAQSGTESEAPAVLPNQQGALRASLPVLQFDKLPPAGEGAQSDAIPEASPVALPACAQLNVAAEAEACAVLRIQRALRAHVRRHPNVLLRLPERICTQQTLSERGEAGGRRSLVLELLESTSEPQVVLTARETRSGAALHEVSPEREVQETAYMAQVECADDGTEKEVEAAEHASQEAEIVEVKDDVQGVVKVNAEEEANEAVTETQIQAVKVAFDTEPQRTITEAKAEVVQAEETAAKEEPHTGEAGEVAAATTETTATEARVSRAAAERAETAPASITTEENAQQAAKTKQEAINVKENTSSTEQVAVNAGETVGSTLHRAHETVYVATVDLQTEETEESAAIIQAAYKGYLERVRLLMAAVGYPEPPRPKMEADSEPKQLLLPLLGCVGTIISVAGSGATSDAFNMLRKKEIKKEEKEQNEREEKAKQETEQHEKEEAEKQEKEQKEKEEKEQRRRHEEQEEQERQQRMHEREEVARKEKERRERQRKQEERERLERERQDRERRERAYQFERERREREAEREMERAMAHRRERDWARHELRSQQNRKSLREKSGQGGTREKEAQWPPPQRVESSTNTYVEEDTVAIVDTTTEKTPAAKKEEAKLQKPPPPPEVVAVSLTDIETETTTATATAAGGDATTTPGVKSNAKVNAAAVSDDAVFDAKGFDLVAGKATTKTLLRTAAVHVGFSKKEAEVPKRSGRPAILDRGKSSKNIGKSATPHLYMFSTAPRPARANTKKLIRKKLMPVTGSAAPQRGSQRTESPKQDAAYREWCTKLQQKEAARLRGEALPNDDTPTYFSVVP
eukprot:TRINITY_DN974_c0_g1_i14.p1 TRINITY_DN974_c0_g1~~TRINITY_DN974_c0_g1_i14.p1  ORF type:complete len:902 (+),score=284.98 TRINITY_DN974_c0_g1_i14:2775-5480(+)